MAKSRRVITKEEFEKLEWLRENVRNVYLHGQTPHWIKDKEDEIIEGDFETGEVKEITVKVRDNLVLQRHIRICADRNICEMVVALVDGFARVLTTRSIRKLETWKEKKGHAKPTREQVERTLRNMQEKGLEAELFITSDYPNDVPSPPDGLC